MAGERENVAIFNPLVLPLPSWHPDGPNGDIDGYVIPFVMPAALAGELPNRGAKLRVVPGAIDGTWTAAVWDCQEYAESAAQARALAAAWIRAAEVLENVFERAPEPATDGVVDAEVVDDDEDQAASPYASDNPGPDQPGHVHQDCCK